MIPEDPLVVPRRALAVVTALHTADVRSVIGGALALAYHVEDPRATRDIDLNIARPRDQAGSVLTLLPEGVEWDDASLVAIYRDGQIRLRWPVPDQQYLPLDLFFAEHEFHRVAPDRALWVPMLDAEVPILSATDLTVFKALFDRPKDWVDIGEMAAYGAPSLDLVESARWVREIVGEDPRIERLLALRQ